MTVWGAIPVKKTISSRGGCELALQPQAQGVMRACLIPINSNLLLLHPQPAASLGWAEMPVVLWEQGKLPGWGSCPSLCRPCCRSSSPAGTGHRAQRLAAHPSPWALSCFSRLCQLWQGLQGLEQLSFSSELGLFQVEQTLGL